MESFLTTNKANWGQFHPRALTHPGVIIDLGCLGWDWSKYFFELKKVYGIDPLEEYQPPGVILHKGLIGNINAKNVSLFGEKEEASIIFSSLPFQNKNFPINTFNWFLSNYFIDKISILKINIEGSEFSLLFSLGEKTFNKIDQISVCFHEFYPFTRYHTKTLINYLSQWYYYYQIHYHPPTKTSKTFFWYLFVKK